MKKLYFLLALLPLMALVSCDNLSGDTDDVVADPITIHSVDFENVERNSATVRMHITGSNITGRGFHYSPDSEEVEQGGGTVVKADSSEEWSEAHIEGLRSNTDYFVRAYAKTASETVYADFLAAFRTPMSYDIGLTLEVSGIGESQAELSMKVESDELFACGFCWSTEPEPTTEDEVYFFPEIAVESFEYILEDLTPATTYYVRAFADNSEGITYSEQKSFTTTTPTVLTALSVAITDVGVTTASLEYMAFGERLTASGVCWSKSENPTVEDNTAWSEGALTGRIVVSFSGLESNTRYFARPFAQDGTDTVYGEVIEFNTTRSGEVTVTTVEAFDITANSAWIRSTATGDYIGERGICYTTSNVTPTVSNSELKIVEAATGELTTELTGLKSNKTYQVRAYVRNISENTVYYGSTVTFTTPKSTEITFTVNEPSGIDESTANISYSIDGDMLTSCGVCWSTTENPTIADSHMEGLPRFGEQTSALTGLTGNMTYYVRAYAVNEGGTHYSEQVSFTTNSDIYYTFPDEGFRKFMVATYDNNKDGRVSRSELRNVRSMTVTDGYGVVNSLEGVEQLESLTDLTVKCNVLKTIDVSSCPALVTLNAKGLTSLESVTAKNMATLEDVRVDSNPKLTSMDLSGSAVSYTSISHNAVTSLDVRGCTKLAYLNANDNKLASIDLASCPALSVIYLDRNELTSFAVDGLQNLLSIRIYDNGKLSNISVANCPRLYSVDFHECRVSQLAVDNCPALTTINCNMNRLTSLPLDQMPLLDKLDAEDNLFTALTFNNTKLKTLNVDNNALLASLDVSGATALTRLDCDIVPALRSLNVDNHPALELIECSQAGLKSISARNCVALKQVYAQYNSSLESADFSNSRMIETIGIHSSVALRSLDASGCTGLTELICDGNILESLKLKDCVSLKKLNCGTGSGNLTNLDLTTVVSLSELYCSGHKLKQIDLSSNNELQTLVISDNLLSGIDLSPLSKLWHFNVSNNKLTTLKIPASVGYVYCSDNELTALDVTACTALVKLECSDNKLTKLNVSNNPALVRLICDNNNITGVLDVSKCGVFRGTDKMLSCNGNPLLTTIKLSTTQTGSNIYRDNHMTIIYE